VEAITQTFHRRQTVYQKNHPIFSEAFAGNEKRVTQWKSFLKKSFLDSSLVFSEVMETITRELLPLYEQLESNNS